jgi:hypothetical protein
MDHMAARACYGLGVDTGVVAVVLLVLAAAIAIIVPYVFRAPGRALKRRFVALGTLKGKTRKEIERSAGQASQETRLPDGRTLLQWRATGYHIALVFDTRGRCDGVTHENGRRVRGSARG